jgi:hypothetical protein
MDKILAVNRSLLEDWEEAGANTVAPSSIALSSLVFTVHGVETQFSTGWY